MLFAQRVSFYLLTQTKMLKKYFALIALVTLAVQIFTVRVASAAEVGSVVINEIAWAGSNDDSGDEWIELYNTTNQNLDLAGWHIKDDGNTTYAISNGTIPAYGYFLIEKDEEAVSNIDADALIGLSLANAGDSLVLFDNAGIEIDSVNSSGGPWYAGNVKNKVSMERVDPGKAGDDAANWASAISGNGSLSSAGAEILGTPGSMNSIYDGAGPKVFISPADALAGAGENVTFNFEIKDAEDLYAYGFDINYDVSVLDFVSAEEENFLSSDGADSVFYSGLENGQEGKLVLGAARIVNPASGISGDGELFSVTFEVVGEIGDEARLDFGGNSFISDVNGDLPFKPMSAKLMVGEQVAPSIAKLSINEGVDRYTLELNWQAPAVGADSYIVQKKMPDGGYTTVGETVNNSFFDNSEILPGISYEYQVIAVKGDLVSEPVSVSGSDSRGLRGDFDRSDRVDGRDIEKLARSYGANYGSETYNLLTDSNYDGVIDGSDLIDIGANFGLVY